MGLGCQVSGCPKLSETNISSEHMYNNPYRGLPKACLMEISQVLATLHNSELRWDLISAFALADKSDVSHFVVQGRE
jgi:hypothetical protein